MTKMTKKYDALYGLKKMVARLIFSPFIREKHKRKYYVSSFSHSFWRSLYMNLLGNMQKEPESFKYQLAFACIIKNEAPYMKEWIDFHQLLGVEHFYVYDNGSTDNILEVLQPYLDKGIVTYTPYPGMYMQHRAYNDVIKKYKNEARWIGFIDPDEFVVPLKKESLPEFLEEYAGYSQVLVYWLMYGSSHHQQKPEGLVIENFRYHAKEPNPLTKAIVNPRKVIYANVHYHYVIGKTVDENLNIQYASNGNLASINKIRVNHYFLKSFEEFSKKHAKGRTDNASFGDLNECFKNADKNDVTDNVMDKYIAIISRQ